jgi:hypothetical protein
MHSRECSSDVAAGRNMLELVAYCTRASFSCAALLVRHYVRHNVVMSDIMRCISFSLQIEQKQRSGAQDECLFASARM